jgi:hypothetical protein
MRNRQIKKIIRNHGMWIPVDGDFINPEGFSTTYFSIGKYETKIPYRKRKPFFPYQEGWFFYSLTPKSLYFEN